MKNNVEKERIEEGSFQIHGIALSYNYIAGARAVIISGADGKMIDAMVLGKDVSPADALRIIHFYDIAARNYAGHISRDHCHSIEIVLGDFDEGRRHHVLSSIHDVVACAEAIGKRDFMGFANRVARKGHFHGIEIVRDSEGMYHMAFSTNLGNQIEISSATIRELVESLIEEIAATAAITQYFKDTSYLSVIRDIMEMLEGVRTIMLVARDLSHVQDISSVTRHDGGYEDPVFSPLSASGAQVLQG